MCPSWYTGDSFGSLSFSSLLYRFATYSYLLPFASLPPLSISDRIWLPLRLAKHPKCSWASVYPPSCPFFSLRYRTALCLNIGQQTVLLCGLSPRQLLALLSVALEASLTQLTHTSLSDDFLVEGTHGVYSYLVSRTGVLHLKRHLFWYVVVLLFWKQFWKCLVSI